MVAGVGTTLNRSSKSAVPLRVPSHCGLDESCQPQREVPAPLDMLAWPQRSTADLNLNPLVGPAAHSSKVIPASGRSLERFNRLKVAVLYLSCQCVERERVPQHRFPDTLGIESAQQRSCLYSHHGEGVAGCWV